MKKPITAGLLLSLMTVAIVAQGDQSRAAIDRRLRAPDKTTAVIATMTPEQKQHARLHAGFKSTDKVLDVGASVDIQVHRSQVSVTLESLPTIVAVACAADVAFVGSVVSSNTFPTLDGTFLFTDYTVRVQEVPHRGVRHKKQLPYRAVVTRPGGALTVGGVSAQTTVSSWPALQVGGTYFFVANQISSTGGYLETETLDAIRLDGQTGQILGDRAPSGIDRNSTIDRDALKRAIVSSQCGKAGL